MNKKQKRNYDWEAIHKDYRTGRFDSDRELCRHWDVPPSTFRKKKKGDPEKSVPAWKRDLEGRFKDRVKNQSIQELAQQSAQPVPSGQKLDDDERTVEDAANAAMVILRRHQKKINDLETISEELRGVLLNAFLNQDPDSIIAWNGGKAESASDMLVKLTKVASDLIKLERQAFNLDDQAVQDESKGITIDKIEIIGVDPEDDLGNS